jgi:hypothetical protein
LMRVTGVGGGGGSGGGILYYCPSMHFSLFFFPVLTQQREKKTTTTKVAQLSHNSSACKRPRDSSAHSSHTAPKRELHTSQQTQNTRRSCAARPHQRQNGIRFPSHGMSNEVVECRIHVTPRSCAARLSVMESAFQITECVMKLRNV